MSDTNRLPGFRKSAFECPHCQAFSEQRWWEGYAQPFTPPGSNVVPVTGLNMAICSHCRHSTFWYNGNMIYPDASHVPPANEDLDASVKADYCEAASILQKSPRGAAALLRLTIQKLCEALGEKGKKIDDDIASLVKKGLSIKIQQALDIVRVIGNEAVHPGTIDLRDDAETASKLFGLINLIADAMISQPKHIEEMYKTLPPDKLKGIEKRDGKS